MCLKKLVNLKITRINNNEDNLTNFENILSCQQQIPTNSSQKKQSSFFETKHLQILIFCVKIKLIKKGITQTMKVTFYVKIEIVREDICSSVWIFLKIRTKSCSFITSILTQNVNFLLIDSNPPLLLQSWRKMSVSRYILF